MNNFGLGHFLDKIFCDIKINYVEFIYKQNSLNNNFKTLKYHEDFTINILSLDNRLYALAQKMAL